MADPPELVTVVHEPIVFTQRVLLDLIRPSSLPSESLQIEIAPVPFKPGPFVCKVAVSKMIDSSALTLIVDPDVPTKFDPESIDIEAPSIVSAPPEVVMVPAVVTLELASISIFRPAVIVPLPVETVEAADEITTSWPASIVAVVFENAFEAPVA
jgi:hypothetical protein